MKIQAKKLILISVVVVLIAVLSSCFTILSVDQPTSVGVGETISVALEVRTEGTDENAHYGIIGLLIPNDWTVNSVSYSGDFGPDEASFLHPDSIDGDPGGQVDYWTDSLETRYPSGDDMQWVVYQANTPYSSALDTGYIDVDVEMIVGNTAGTYNIGYFVTNAALDFTDSTYYDISLDNQIEVTGGTGVETNSVMPSQFNLSQNYPNPFNPTTTISFELPVSGKTTLKIYNLLGNEVATLVNGYVSAGSHQIVFDASKLETGIYYYKLTAGDFSATKKLILIK